MTDPRSITDRLAEYGITHEAAPICGKRVLRNRDSVVIGRFDFVGAAALLEWFKMQPNEAAFRA
jgi:hypothetical protein